MGYSKKKKKTNGWDMNFYPELLKKQNVVYTNTHSTKKEVEFSGVFKIEQLQVEFPWVLVFDLGISEGVIKLCRISRGLSACFLQNFSVVNDHMIQCMIV